MTLIKHLTSQLHGANIDEIANLHGWDKNEIIDFSSNLNPMGPSKNAELAVIENFGNIINYPSDNNRLKNALSGYLHVDSDNLFIDNGSAALIYKLFTCFNFKKASILKPTFCEYEKASLAFSCRITAINLTDLKNNNFDSDVIFICNPNNPTAELLEKKLIKKIAEKAAEKGAVLVIDEAFIDFVDDKPDYSVIDLVEEIPNLIVLGSLTKFFALAGLRIGYACTGKEIIERLQKKSPPWLINTLTEQAAYASISDSPYIAATKTQIPKLRQNMISELENIKSVKAYDSKINFILVEIKKPVTSTFIYHELAKRKILIRDCASFNMGTQFIRLAVKLPFENKLLAQNLSGVLS